MNKRLWTLAVLAALLIAAGTGVGHATASLCGPTGIVSVPTAAVAPVNTLQAALTYQSLETTDMYAPSTSENFRVWSLQALAGITDQAELWAAYSAVRDGQSSHIWGLGGQMLLTKEPEEATALAVGASYQRWVDVLAVDGAAMYGDSDVNVTKLYIVATKDFTPMSGERWEWGPGAGTRMLGSFGLLYLRANPAPATGNSESLTRPFVGFEFIGAGGTTLGLEYRWKDDNIDEKAVFSAVLRHLFSPELTGEIGTTNATPVGTGLNDQDVFVRVIYTVPLGVVR